MPLCNIKGPPGMGPIARKKMLEDVTKAIEEGYQHIGVTIVVLEEDALDHVMIAGHMTDENPKYEEFRKNSA